MMTVSRALRTPERVSAETRRKIDRAVRELAYVPDLVARSLASDKTRVVAAIVPIINAVFADTIAGMNEVLDPHGYQILMGISDYSLAKEEALVTAFLGRRVDGICVTGCSHTPRARALLQRAAIPVVEMWNLSRNPIDIVVGFSQYQASRHMTRHLASLGRRRIGFIGGATRSNDRTRDRERGYDDEMRALGLDPDPSLKIERAFHFAQGADGLAALLARVPDLDAVYGASDMLAAGAVFECQRRGIAVPGRIAIGGIDDGEIAAAMVPSLTTIRVPRREMGREAARCLIGARNGDRIIDLGFEMLRRETA